MLKNSRNIDTDSENKQTWQRGGRPKTKIALILAVVVVAMTCTVVGFAPNKSIATGVNTRGQISRASVETDKVTAKMEYARASATMFDKTKPKAKKVASDITGGQQATPNSIPFIASVQHTNGFHFCTGSIVGPKNVLTAAHCCAGQTASGIRVVVGEHTINAVEPNTEQILSVSAIKMHSGYDSNSLVNDVCLLELTTAMAYNTYVKQAILPLQGQAPPAQDTSVIAAGWGNAQLDTAGSNVLNFVELKVKSDATCQSAWGGFFKSHMICATDPGQGACQGDSGGPLFVQSSNQVIGVASFVSSQGCGHAQYGSVYAEVSHFVDWIVARLAPLDCGSTVSASVVSDGKAYFVVKPPSDPSVNVMTMNMCGSQIDSWLYVYNGAGATTTTPIYHCDDCGPCGWRTVQTFYTNGGGSPALSKGSPYTVGVGAFSTGAGDFTMTLTCASAELSCGSTATGSISAYGTQFYSLSVPQHQTTITLNTCASEYDTWLYMYMGTTETYNCDDCGHTTCPNNVLYRTVQEFQANGAVTTLPALEAGYTYRVGVGGFSGASGNIHLAVSCT